MKMMMVPSRYIGCNFQCSTCKIYRVYLQGINDRIVIVFYILHTNIIMNINIDINITSNLIVNKYGSVTISVLWCHVFCCCVVLVCRVLLWCCCVLFYGVVVCID